VLAGAGDRRASDMGPFLSCSFTDPDRAGHQVISTTPDAASDTTRRRADRTTVETA